MRHLCVLFMSEPSQIESYRAIFDDTCIVFHRYRLRVDLWDWEGGRSYAEYETFYVSSAESKYKLRARDYSGDAGQ